ncbi:MAG: hypothetical protein Q9159_006859 [Coniocarpon cinnabarinum]
MSWRQKITFVKQTREDDAKTQQESPKPTESKIDWGELYRSVAFPNGPSAVGSPASIEDVDKATCEVCGGELPANEASRKAHASSVAHQLAIGASSRAPSAINRQSKGFKMMEMHGYDPDEDRGLGVEGKGLQKPIEVRQRRKETPAGEERNFNTVCKAVKMQETQVVVIGAGVIGLTTALLLAEDERPFSITVVAKHMPGDSDIEYASPWAGANWSPGASKRAGTLRAYEIETYPRLAHIAQHHPEAGIHVQRHVSYSRSASHEDSEPWHKDVLSDFKHHAEPSHPDAAPFVTDGRFPLDYKSVNTSTSVCINSAVYTSWLLSKCLEKGIIVRRADLSHLLDAGNLHHSSKAADVIVNCTGLGARNLKGVSSSANTADPTQPQGDAAVFPIRGQIVLVRNSPGMMVDSPVRLDTPTEVTYIMERAAGGGTILGGSYEPNRWDSAVDPNLSNRIMSRAIEIVPSLVSEEALEKISGKKGGKKGVEGLSVIRHGVGLRPSREGGARIERVSMGRTIVVHQYGHGGAGYQSSFGTARHAIDLIKEGLDNQLATAKL